MAVFAAYVLVFVLSKGSDSWLPFLSLLALGFVLGAVTSSWWVVAVGVLAASVGGDWLEFVGAWLPGAIAFGVLGEQLRRSDLDAPIAGWMAKAGSVLLLAGIIGFLAFATGYNDDAPSSAGAGLGFLVALFAAPLGLGLFCAGILGMFRR